MQFHYSSIDRRDLCCCGKNAVRDLAREIAGKICHNVTATLSTSKPQRNEVVARLEGCSRLKDCYNFYAHRRLQKQDIAKSLYWMVPNSTHRINEVNIRSVKVATNLDNWDYRNFVTNSACPPTYIIF